MALRFTGYANILGPEQVQFTPGHPGRRIHSPADYLGWHTRVTTSRKIDPWDSPTGVIARINHGRWICDCVWCEGGMLTRPDWAVAYCAECGARYHLGQVSFPKNVEELAKVLLVRIKRSEQNWDQRQTVRDLEEENKRPEVITADDIPEARSLTAAPAPTTREEP